MAKRPRTSISELVAKKTTKLDLDAVNEIAEKIHAEKKPVKKPAVKKKETAVATNPKKKTTRRRNLPDIADRTKRISLNAPLELYLDIQREATLQGISMMQYILEIVEEDIKRNK